MKKITIFLLSSFLLGSLLINAEQKIISGWASKTNFKNAETTVQKNVVNKANSANGQLSGKSIIGVKWATDIAGGDGDRMRKAINIYDTWVKDKKKTKNITQIKSDMIAAFNGSQYNNNCKNTLVSKIISVYDSKKNSNSLSIPTTDQATLDFLGIQKQCLEWAETIAQSCGGKINGYDGKEITDQSKFRPGMGLYKTDRSHAMIIIDIEWDKNGKPINFKVAESNWSSGWTNPKGAIPWERKINNTRITQLSGCKVISYE